MGKILLLSSFLGLMFIAVGVTVAPQDLIFWFTATTPLFQYIRIGLAFILLLQLFTRPPRHVIFRILAGFIGLSASLWVLEETFAYRMPLLDCLSLLSAGLAISITALERRIDIPTRTSSKNKVFGTDYSLS